MKRSLTSLISGLVLSSALAFNGCSVSDTIRETPERISNFVRNITGEKDSVDLYKEHPEYLTQFLENFTGTDGLAAIVSPFSITFDLKGKHDELVVKAIYTLIPNDNGKGAPNLFGYVVYDVKEEAIYSYTATTMPQKQSPEMPSSDKYRADENKNL